MTPHSSLSGRNLKSADTPRDPLVLELSRLPALNLALQQNRHPIIQSLKLTNLTDRDFRALTCTISANPEIFPETVLQISSAEAGESIVPVIPDILPNYDFLSKISDTVAGTLNVKVSTEDEGLILSRNFPVAAYAPDQWLGSDSMPELLAAFVTPNLEVISSILSRTSDELLRATNSSAVQGYQADKKRCYEICAAVYRAISSLGIRYCNPPASFGAPGQRIRLSDTTCQGRLGTCLDLAILFASVLEQCNLHPVILIQEGHAYIGCHLRKYYFPDTASDDLQAIRKLVDLDEFIVWECTCVCGNTSFGDAEKIARETHLNEDEQFRFAVDIVRARNSGIRPLPILRSAGGLELGEEPPPPDALPCDSHRELCDSINFSELSEKTPAGRIRRWQQKLLDLSLRNRLLNVRENSRLIPLICSDITKLEDKIATRENLSIKPISNLLGEKDLHDISQSRSAELKTEIRTLLAQELEQRRLWTPLSEEELQRRLKDLYRQGKTDLEESGVNTLFLGIGFLERKDSSADSVSRLAPILLIPIRLQRRSIAEAITISRLDEDTMINVTLLELLRRDYRLEIPGLQPLPTDETGIDVNRVIRIFRQAVLPMKGWEVREDAKIGLFSFGKFIMWNDLVNRTQALREHPIVNHLIEGGGFFEDGIEVFPPEAIAENLDPAKLFCPMNADSSQLTAVRYSELGKNFVLHGPPGTGKSQTITNIIAHNLALGKRVLFVSEKKAALDVVHNRLCSIGLRPFCLELHSNKAGKLDVMKQLSESLNVADSKPPKDWDKTVADLERSRKSLNRYVSSLHKIYPNGLSANDCFSDIFKSEKSGLCDFNLPIDCLTHSREDYSRTTQAGTELSSAFSVVAKPVRETFDMLDPADWTPAFERSLLSEASTTGKAAHRFAKRLREFAATLNANLPDIFLPKKLNALLRIAKSLNAPHNIPATLLVEAFPQHEKFLKKFLTTLRERNRLAARLSAFNTEKLSDLDCDGIDARIKTIRKQFIVLRLFSSRTLLKELAGIKRIGSGKLTLDELENSLDSIRSFCEKNAICASCSRDAEALLGELLKNENPDSELVLKSLEDCKTILSATREIAEPGTDAYTAIIEKLKTVLPFAESRFAAETLAQKQLNELLYCETEYAGAKEKFAGTFSRELRASSISPEKLAEKLDKFPDYAVNLRRAMLYIKTKYNAETLGLRPIIEALEQEKFPPEELKNKIETAYRKTMLEQVLSADSVLSGFIGEHRNAEIQRFRELDSRYLSLSKEIIFAQLAKRLPKTTSGKKTEIDREIGILKRECEKRMRQKPLRQLLELTPTVIPLLKPCFLMSPLSVAQYLSAGSDMFDLVIFDEASQIPVWDAIGAIARGKQLIVVGDPKQLPPTSFFQHTKDREDIASEEDEEEISLEAEEDLESILDECLAAGLFSAHLNWHYRSKNEALISFSNHHYYEDRLMTFPAANNAGTHGVRFEFVENGIYDRRRKRTNKNEAKQLVRHIFERLADPKTREKSIGVVCFSQAQKDLIEDIIERERAARPEFEKYFSSERNEAFFVKNLENVQGDERDIILFSVGYAPDSKGFMSMNFGPLNRQGGERRLNVAITRAKEQIVVFSSIRPSQIDLSRTRATGAAHLRYFLEHAEKNPRLLSNQSTPDETSSGLAETIAEFLKSNGYAVKRNVGNSGMRIDIAVLRPDFADSYLLGIECDGKSYRNQKTTRDRDHLRENVLKSLGWKIFRAWTIDWAFDRAQAERALLAELEKAKNELSETPVSN